MKRPRRRPIIYIALGSILGALCWAVMTYVDRPPHEFLRGSQLFFVQMSTTTPDKAWLYYASFGSDLDSERVRARAQAELHVFSKMTKVPQYTEGAVSLSFPTPKGLREIYVLREDFAPSSFQVGDELIQIGGGAALDRYEAGVVMEYVPPLPTSSNLQITVIAIKRKATALDRMRSWTYHMNWKGLAE